MEIFLPIFVLFHPHVLSHSSFKKILIRNYFPRGFIGYRDFFTEKETKSPRECPPSPVPKTSKTKTKTSAVRDWKRGPRVTALVVGHGVSAGGEGDRNNFSQRLFVANRGLRLWLPLSRQSPFRAILLPRPPSSLNHPRNRTLFDLGSIENFGLGIGPIPSIDVLLPIQLLLSRIKERSTRFVSIALSLSLHRLICGRARSQTIGRRSPIPYLSPLLDLMAADNWLQVGPGSSIRGVHAWNPRTIEFHSAVAPTFRKIGTDFLR